MESRFGLKDFIVFFLIFALGASVLLLLVQGERRWEETRALRQSVEQQTKLLADIERALKEERAAAVVPKASSWARPNVPITTPRP